MLSALKELSGLYRAYINPKLINLCKVDRVKYREFVKRRQSVLLLCELSILRRITMVRQ